MIQMVLVLRQRAPWQARSNQLQFVVDKARRGAIHATGVSSISRTLRCHRDGHLDRTSGDRPASDPRLGRKRIYVELLMLEFLLPPLMVVIARRVASAS